MKSWIHFLKEKKQSLEKFKEFKTMIEKQIRNVIKRLRTNNGEEFTIQTFSKFCIDNGVI